MEKQNPKIYELPSEIQARVFQLQIEAGNKPDATLELIAKSTEGNFDWHRSPERHFFWSSVNDGWYIKFYKKYPNELVNNPLYKWKTEQNTSFSKQVITGIMRSLPINLSADTADELKAHIDKHFDSWDLDGFYWNRVKIEDEYKLKIRKRYSALVNLIDTTWPTGLYTLDPEQGEVGVNVMLTRFICEVGDMMKDAFIESLIAKSELIGQNEIDTYENILEEAILKINSGARIE